MKKLATILLSSMLLSATLVGCGSSDTSTGAVDTSSGDGAVALTPTTNQSAVITMGGSTSVEEIISAMQQVYMEANDGVSITYSGTGSSAGVTGVLDGSLNLGLASRGLKDSEVEAGAVAIPFAYDGIAVIIHTDNPVTDLTTEDLAKIFTGEITNWSDLGGQEGQIVVVGRDAASGTRGAFEEILGVEDETVYDSEQSATGGVISTVQTNSAAIGYVSLSSVDEKVVAVTIDGVAPSEETIKDESYPIQRPFVFVVNGDAADTGVDAFVAWATSAEVAEIVTSKGAVAP